MTEINEATPEVAPIDEVSEPKHSFFNRLYTGSGAIDVIGKRRVYFGVIGLIVLISLLSIIFRGFTFGIDFQGGSQIQFPQSSGVTTKQVSDVFSRALGKGPVSVQTVGSGSGATFQIRSEALDQKQTETVQKALFQAFHPKDAHGKESINAISTSNVSATWGGQITKKALWALGTFLVLVSAYIAIRYERDMALSALASLILNMMVTAGIYSLVGFEVSPATVIGMLTILGFSLYDSVVVFDKVEENTRGILHLNRRTYGEQANLAVNQTLMRSINTTIIGVLPVLSLMVIAVWLLGVGTLKDLALVQLVGMIVGTFSSIFFATPLLVAIKERFGPVAAHTRKVKAKRAQTKTRGEQNGVGQAVDAVPSGYVPPRERRVAPAGPRPGARPTGKRSRGR